MASEIVGSLFGVTPELYQEQRDLMRQKQAMAFAQQDPRAQATYGLYRAGQQAGQALGGLMGVEDPQMRLISQRNALAKQIDMNDPESIMRGAQMAAQAGDTVAASTLAEYARKAASDLALIQQRLRERQGVDPIQQLIRAGKHTPQSIDLYSKSGNIQDLELIEKSNKTVVVGNSLVDAVTGSVLYEGPNIQKYSEFAKTLIDAGLKPGTEPFQKRMLEYATKKVEGAGKGTGNVTIYPPGTPIPQKDWIDFRKFADSNPIMKKTTALISEAPNAIETIGQVTSNDIAAKALPATLARLTGDTGILSNQDITRYARTGGLDDRLAQSAAQFFTGRGTAQQKDQAMRFVSAIYRGALIEQRQFIVDEAKQLGYTGTSNYDTMLKTIDDKLAKFKEVKPGENIPAPTTQSDDALINKYRPVEKK